MKDYVRYEVGASWPYPSPGSGMMAIIEPANEAGLSLTLAAGCDRPTAAERKAMAGPLQIAALSSPPLAWIALDAGEISWDAPYAPALAGADHGREIKAGAARAASLPDDVRTLIDVVVIDRGLIHAIRTVTLTRAWWRALAAAIAASPDEVSRAAYTQAVANDQTRMTTMQMIAAAQAVEIAGRV